MAATDRGGHRLPATLSIDLNADVGEGCGPDAALLRHVSSANIACGGHAGDVPTARACITAALDLGVVIGAHPGYPDRAHFGRRELELGPELVCELVRAQVEMLAELTARAGGRLVHVKPHGALYNQAARDPQLAEAVAHAVHEVDRKLALVGLAGGELTRAAARLELRFLAEAFVDRRYGVDGVLLPRGSADAVIDDAQGCLAQALDLIERGGLRVADAGWLPIAADTLCLHGDGPRALETAARLRAALDARGIAVRSPAARH